MAKYRVSLQTDAEDNVLLPLPGEICAQLGVGPGAEVEIDVRGGTVRLAPLKSSPEEDAVPPVDRQPQRDATMLRWRVMRVQDDSYLIGWCVEDHAGRVSSPIVSFDGQSRVVETRTDRRFRLEGLPGLDSDAEDVWKVWMQLYDVDAASVTDVSAEYVTTAPK
jgi:hypothetical protein